VRVPRPVAALVAAFGLAASACTASHPLDTKERAVVAAPETVAWQPATRGDVVGYFESERITGEAAASLRKVLYSFAEDGTWTGAALVQEGARATFQTLSGTWRLEGATLHLGDDAAPARASAAPGRLRLESEGGTAYFLRGKAD